MKIPSLSITLAAIMSVGTVANADTLVIGGGATHPATGVPVETWIRSDNVTNNPDDNFNFVGSLAGGADLRGLIGFDLSNPLLDGATITSVTITLYQSSETTGSSGTSGLYDLDLSALTGSVNNTATWNSASGLFSTTLASTTGNPTSVTTNAPFFFNSNPDLVNYVQSALTGNAVQFGLKSDALEALTERNFFVFGQTFGKSGNAPSMTITYTPVPEPSTALAGLLLGAGLLRRRRRGERVNYEG
jgi:hypothetical protein